MVDVLPRKHVNPKRINLIALKILPTLLPWNQSWIKTNKKLRTFGIEAQKQQTEADTPMPSVDNIKDKNDNSD